MRELPKIQELPNKFSEINFLVQRNGILESLYRGKKTDTPERVCPFWLRYRDSNPDRQSQRLQCYLYTISQYRACYIKPIYYNCILKICQGGKC